MKHHSNPIFIFLCVLFFPTLHPHFNLNICQVRSASVRPKLWPNTTGGKKLLLFFFFHLKWEWSGLSDTEQMVILSSWHFLALTLILHHLFHTSPIVKSHFRIYNQLQCLSFKIVLRELLLSFCLSHKKAHTSSLHRNSVKSSTTFSSFYSLIESKLLRKC